MTHEYNRRARLHKLNRARKAWLLRQQGLTYAEIAKQIPSEGGPNHRQPKTPRTHISVDRARQLVKAYERKDS